LWPTTARSGWRVATALMRSSNGWRPRTRRWTARRRRTTGAWPRPDQFAIAVVGEHREARPFEQPGEQHGRGAMAGRPRRRSARGRARTARRTRPGSRRLPFAGLSAGVCPRLPESPQIACRAGWRAVIVATRRHPALIVEDAMTARFHTPGRRRSR
jgi:hypothetical protein